MCACEFVYVRVCACVRFCLRASLFACVCVCVRECVRFRVCLFVRAVCVRV